MNFAIFFQQISFVEHCKQVLLVIALLYKLKLSASQKSLQVLKNQENVKATVLFKCVCDLLADTRHQRVNGNLMASQNKCYRVPIKVDFGQDEP